MATAQTDTASIYALAPEQLAHLFEDGIWFALYQKGNYEAAELLIRQHGGAVFHTGKDGPWDVKLNWQGNVPVSEEGYVMPYRVAARFLKSIK